MAWLRLIFSEILTWPVPPIILPYMVRMKMKVETIMSAAIEFTDILPVPA